MIFSIAASLYRAKKGLSEKLSNFCVFIPAYKEDGVIVQVAKRALKQNYKGDYQVIVIADSFQPETLEKLKELPIRVIEVSFEKSTKVKALNKAMNIIDDSCEYCIIIDADNVMENDFITKMNSLHNVGFKAIQGRRAAKNRQNSMALLDGLSEEINNYFFGKGSTSLGLSAALKGSGMSFDFALFKEQLGKMDSVGGFDRELEVRLVNIGLKVLYAHNVVVYDEKVSNQQVFENQRTRWVSSQFIYLRKFFKLGVRRLFIDFDLVFFNSAILRNIQLPRLLNLGLMGLTGIVAIVFSSFLHVPTSLWLIAIAITYLATLVSIPSDYLNKKLFISILRLPLIFISLFKALFGISGANKEFIHTPHSDHNEDSQ